MTTTQTTQPKYRIITLTGRAPVRIREDQWPILAIGRWRNYDNQYEFQANRTWDLAIRVRRREDGKTIVYGTYEYDTHFQGEPCFAARVGVLGDVGQDVAGLIERVGDLLALRFGQGENESAHEGADHITEVVAECIGDLPAEDL